MGIIAGLIGNRIKIKKVIEDNDNCYCNEKSLKYPGAETIKKSFASLVRSVFKFAYIQMPKEIGKETLL